MPSAGWFLLLIALVALERLAELRITRRHAARLRDRGGFEVAPEHYRWMVLLHTGVLVAAPLEVVLVPRSFVPWVGWPMLGVVASTMALRYWVIATLGDRWTTRIFVVPGEGPVTSGPYRWLRHPNYLAVILEVAALPLVHGAWWTALAASAANALVLRVRIQAEEAALEAAAGYGAFLTDRRGLLPGPPR
ncbi:MAG: isoprenylcysteine carboxylmethyltransferase family protein [Acidobacteriota bacterium]